MKRRSLLALILVIQIASVSFAQQPAPSPIPKPAVTPAKRPQSEDEDVVRITTNLVQVDAVVTDKSGKVVTDLRPEEVQIFEDRKQQRISHFSYIVTGAEESPAPIAHPAVIDKNATPAPPTRLK